MDAAQREKFFEESEIGGEIRKEVESLLLFEKESEDFMHLSAVEFLKDFIDFDDENSLLGQNVGVYKLSANAVTAEWARFICRKERTENPSKRARRLPKNETISNYTKNHSKIIKAR